MTANRLEQAISILERLVGFNTITGRPNGGIVSYISDYLAGQGIAVSLSHDKDGQCANLFATIGPHTDGGVVLSGHMDVVPVAGQDWSSDPFALTRRDDRLYGRGSVDMKGFLASALAMVPEMVKANLERPIHLAFSRDEETGGMGMPDLLADMATKGYRPDVVIVGEPTRMKIISGHKGGLDLITTVTGEETHSSNPLNGVNAISYAARVIAKIDEIAARHAAHPREGSGFVPAWSTFNIGIIRGGEVRNATAGACAFDWEIRPMPGSDGTEAVAEVDAFARDVLIPEMRQVSERADIQTTTRVNVPPLDDSKAGAAIAFVASITGQNATDVVSFGTDAGYFSDADYSTVVFGPGNIDRAHKADEFITTGELAEGLGFIGKIVDRLTA